MQREKYKITALEMLTENISQFQLEPCAGIIDLLPGQYVWLKHDNQQIPFSVAGFKKNHLVFHIKHGDENPIAEKILKSLQTTEIFELEGPGGQCVLPSDNASPLVFVAGGTGIAPHKAILEHLIAQKNQPPVLLYWGIRNLKDYYLQAWFEGLSQHAWLEHHLVLSEQDHNWDGPTGFVHQAFLDSHTVPKGAIVYASGPYPMVTALQQSLIGEECTLLCDMITADA